MNSKFNLLLLLLITGNGLFGQFQRKFDCIGKSDLDAISSFSTATGSAKSDALLYDSCQQTYAIFWLQSIGSLNYERIDSLNIIRFHGNIKYRATLSDTLKEVCVLDFQFGTVDSTLLVLSPSVNAPETAHLEVEFKTVLAKVKADRLAKIYNGETEDMLYHLSTQVLFAVLSNSDANYSYYTRLRKEFEAEEGFILWFGQYMREIECILRSNHLLRPPG